LHINNISHIFILCLYIYIYIYIKDTYPKSLYFGFQFYTFPYMYTKKLELYTGPIPHQDVSHRRSSSVPRQRTRNWSQNSFKSTRSQFDGGMVGAISDNQDNPIFPGILYQYSDDGHPNCNYMIKYF